MRYLLFVVLLGSCFGQVTLNAGSFGFTCPNTQYGCGSPPSFPNVVGQPQVARLWTSGASWGQIDGGSGKYTWNVLNAWLDTCAKNAATVVCDYQIAGVPPYVSPTGQSCLPGGCPGPPSDLARPGGSPAFHAFIKQLINHCSLNGNCFKDVIKIIEVWNEFNSLGFWAATGNPICGVNQTNVSLFEADCGVALYQLISPEIPQIRAAMPGVTIQTPNIDDAQGYIAFQPAACNYIQQEVKHSIYSQVFGFHVYWVQGSNAVNPEAPAVMNMAKQMVSINLNPAVTCAPYIIQGDGSANNYNIVGWSGPWTPLPMYETETGYSATSPYTCPQITTAPNVCGGEPVRHQLLIASMGVQGVSWYTWYRVIANSGNPITLSDYVAAENMLNGQIFSTPCKNPTGGIWTCPVAEGNGTPALWVWSTNTAGENFNVPSTYVTYRDLHGNSGGVQSTMLATVEPILLEQSLALAPPTNLTGVVQ